MKRNSFFAVVAILLVQLSASGQKLPNVVKIGNKPIKGVRINANSTRLYNAKPYYIQSAINYGKNKGGFWDMPGYPKKITKGMNIQVYDFETNKDRKFYVVESNKKGFYEIKPGWQRNIRVDVSGGAPSMRKNGANIHSWDKNGGDWQKFRFKHLGGGRFKIYTTSGMALCLAQRSSKNGSNVHIWQDHEGPWMEWYLIDTETNKPFIPRFVKPYAPNRPEFFERNRNVTFKYVQQTAFSGGTKGTAKVVSVSGNTVKLRVNFLATDQRTGKKQRKIREITLLHRNGKYSEGKWDCEPCGKGQVKIYPDGKQVLDLSGEQHSTEFIIEAK